jgi:hypothetical protein
MLRKLRDEASGEPLRTGDPIPFGRLARETVGLLRGSWSAAWPAWASVLMVQVAVYGLAAGVLEPRRALPVSSYTALYVAEVAATSVPYAIGLRLALGARRPLALDAGFALFLGLNLAGAVIEGAWNAVGELIMSDFAINFAADLGVDRDGTGALMVVASAHLVSYLALTVALVMLSLWPIGALMRQAGASAGKSWRDMKGAAIPIQVVMWGGVALVEIALWTLRRGLPPFALGYETSLLNEFASSLAYYPFGLLLTAAYAAAWRIRSGDAARRITAFD